MQYNREENVYNTTYVVLLEEKTRQYLLPNVHNSFMLIKNRLLEL